MNPTWTERVIRISKKIWSFLGGILAILVAFLRDIPVPILTSGNNFTLTGFYSLAMFATPEFEVFTWGTIAGETVTLLAGFSLEGLASLILWGILVIAAILAFSAASPRAKPALRKAQRVIAALLLFGNTVLFLVLALFCSPLGLSGLRLGWFCVAISGVCVSFSIIEKES